MDHVDPSRARIVSRYQATGVQSAAAVSMLPVSLASQPAVRCTQFFPVCIGVCYPEDDSDRLLLWIRMRGVLLLFSIRLHDVDSTQGQIYVYLDII
jgi:hypothetical protein